MLPRQLLVVLAERQESTPARLLRERGVALAPSARRYEVQTVIAAHPSQPGLETTTAELPEEARSLLERARELAVEMNHPLIGTEHLFVAALETPEVAEWEPVRTRGLNADEVRAALFTGNEHV